MPLLQETRKSRPSLTRVTFGLLALVLAACAGRRCDPNPELKGARLECESALKCRDSIAGVCFRSRGSVHILALSGGGQYGAFGAGVLAGWREASPPRPSFQVVTGVSVGALLATHAFLDTPRADRELAKLFTSVSQGDIYSMRSLRGISSSESLAEADGLKDLIREHLHDGVLKSVAAAARDRLLLVGTVNLDLGTFQTWDMTAIARSGDFDLYRRVIRASASVPVLLPPVQIGDHLHVDGSAREQVFIRNVCDGVLQGMQSRKTAQRSEQIPQPVVHVIVNGGIGVGATCVQPNIQDVGLRSVETLLDEALVGNLWRIWGVTKRYGLGFRMIEIPSQSVPVTSGSFAFDRREMRQLFELGKLVGARSEYWRDTPEP